MTPLEILEIDAKRNHEDMTAQDLVDAINGEIKVGGHVVREGNTLTVFKSTEKGRAEFHCFNADSPTNFVQNVLKFLALFKKLGYTYADTPFDNPRVGELLQQHLPQGSVQIKPVSEGVWIGEVTL